MRNYSNYTDEDIIKYSAEVFSMSALLKKLNIKPVGGNFATIKRKLQILNLDCEHWTGQAWNKGERLKDWQNYTRPSSVKKHLITERGHGCEDCLNSTWKNLPIPLEIHHIDGNRTNNVPENLQLLCCNCHALTPNWRNNDPDRQKTEQNPYKDECLYCGKQKTKRAIRCKDCSYKHKYPDDGLEDRGIYDKRSKNNCECGKLKLSGSKLCKTCNNVKAKTKKIEWPSPEEMYKLVWSEPSSTVAKSLGVSDSAIGKFCRQNGVEKPPSGYWNKVKAGIIVPKSFE